MTILIQLTNGRQFRCTINDSRASAEFLRNIEYWEIFERAMLRVHCARDTWMLNPEFIEKIHFMTEFDPGWRPPENIIAAKCISPATYQNRRAALDAGERRAEDQFEEGRLAEAVVKVTLASGAVEYFQYLVMLSSPMEQRMNLSLFFHKVAYTTPCEEGGFMLINPARIICVHLHPAPPESPESAWLVEEFTEPSES